MVRPLLDNGTPYLTHRTRRRDTGVDRGRGGHQLKVLRLELTDLDLERVRVVRGLAPMVELGSVVRSGHRGTGGSHLLAARAFDLDPAKLAMVTALIPWRCSPAFLHAIATDADEAVETVVSTPAVMVRRDLDDNVAAGLPLPAWTADLARVGRTGTERRHELRTALRHVIRRRVRPTTLGPDELVAETVHRVERLLASVGAAAALGRLHHSVRLRRHSLEVDLVSGADVSARATGAGITLVPTLSTHPSVTVSSDGTSPTRLMFPVHVPRTAAARFLPPVPSSHLISLIGASRARVLLCIAVRPGMSTREVAIDTGLSESSASEHATVLRRNGLVETRREGSRVAHHSTDTGLALLRA